MAYLPQRVMTMFPEAMCVETAIGMWAHIGGRYVDYQRRKELCDKLGLNQLYERVKLKHPDAMSGGQAQQIGLLLVHLMDADIVLLDEPTAAIAPEGRDKIKGIIQALVDDVDRRRFALVATHDSEIQAMSNRIEVFS